MSSKFRRYGIYSIDHILPELRNKDKRQTYIVFNGMKIIIACKRFPVFQKSIICAKCGLEAKFIALEYDIANPRHKGYTFNLYGRRNNREIIFTKDHIIPKSKGGTSRLDNLQTMCSPCNTQKGNNYES